MRVGRGVAGALIGLVCLLTFGLTAACSNPMNPDCTVGYAGSDLNIEVQGLGADSACQGLIKSAPASSSDQTPIGSGYERQPGGTLMCRVRLNGPTSTVSDS